MASRTSMETSGRRLPLSLLSTGAWATETEEEPTEAPTQAPAKKTNQKAPSAPGLTAVTGTSITVKTVKGQQYSIDGGKKWQTSGTFKNLTPGKQYTVVTRKAETAAANASPKSAGAKAKTLSNAMLLRSGLKVQETTKNKKTTISVTEGKVPGATSYQVFVQYCDKGSFGVKAALTMFIFTISYHCSM